MTDQEIFPKQPPSATATDNVAKTVPEILGVFNGLGEPIVENGVTKNGDLRFQGSGPSGHWLDVWDRDLPVNSSVLVDEDGRFDIEMPHQSLGLHEYSFLEPHQQQWSNSWPVYVDVAEAVTIDYVGDSNGPIEHGGSTTYGNLEFFGQGIAGSTVNLLDNGKVLVTTVVDANRYWNAQLKDLKTGSHHFTAQVQDGEVSRPLSVLITKPAPLTIEYAVGQRHFQKIRNQEGTIDDVVTLVGIANPGEKGRVVDNSGDLLPFTANKRGVWEVTIENLVAGGPYYYFRLKSDQGRVSQQSFAIRVLSSKLPK
jgi:hypothetical protein